MKGSPSEREYYWAERQARKAAGGHSPDEAVFWGRRSQLDYALDGARGRGRDVGTGGWWRRHPGARFVPQKHTPPPPRPEAA